MKATFWKGTCGVVVTLLLLAAMPVPAVSAADSSAPPPPWQAFRFERTWERMLRHYARVGDLLDRGDDMMAKSQAMIDRLAEEGKDVSGLEAALDDFAASLKAARPLYASGQGIVNSHAGFDSDGKVTDPEAALETIQALGDKLREIQDAMGGTGRALRDAIWDFREANPPPWRTDS